MKCRVVQKKDGSVVIVYPNIRHKLKAETEDQYFDRVIDSEIEKIPSLKDLPFKDIDSSQIPNTRRFRDSWKLNGTKVEVDIKKARSQRMGEIRRERDTRLKESDGKALRESENGGVSTKLKKYRKDLRDIPQTTDLSGITDPDALAGVEPAWPAEPED